MRKIALILCVITATLIGTFFSVSCYEEPCTVELNIELNARETGYTVKGIKQCKCTKVEIPEMVEDLPVVEIATSAFKDNQNIKEVIIPKTVTRICQSAFENCIELEKVTFASESSLTTINKNAFRNCAKLKDVVIPEKVKTMQYGAFMDCKSLTEIVIPSTLKTITQFAFGGCSSLEKVTLPETLKGIEYYAFNDCVKLTTITYLGSAEDWGKLVLDELWNNKTPLVEITCSNGKVDIN